MATITTPIKSPNYTQPFTLTPVNLDDQNEITELIRQRKLCGWNYDMEAINKWREQIARSAKYMWWIEVPPSNSASTSTLHPDQVTPQVGHIALASETYPPDSDLARSDKSILTVTSFFILQSYRAGGLGRASWLEVEERARQIPECRQICIDTWDRRYVTEDTPEWTEMVAKNGFSMKKEDGFINEDWYARMGYVKFKTLPRYPMPVTNDLMIAVFMRKDMK